MMIRDMPGAPRPATPIRDCDVANVYRELGDVLVCVQHNVAELLAHWSARQAAAPSDAGDRLLHDLTLTLDFASGHERWFAQCAGRAQLRAERRAEWPFAPQVLPVPRGPAGGPAKLLRGVDPLHGDSSDTREVA